MRALHRKRSASLPLLAVLVVALAGLGLLAARGLAIGTAAAQGQSYLRIGTGSIAGTYFPIGQALAAILSMPAGSNACETGGRCGVPGLLVTALASEGSVANVKAVARGTLETAFAQADVVHWAYGGTGVFAGEEPASSLRVIANLYAESVHVVARKGAGIERIADLKGKRVSLDQRGAGSYADALLILGAYGLTTDDLKLDSAEIDRAAEEILAGTLDALIFVGGTPAPMITELAEAGAITLVPITAPEVNWLTEKVRFLTPDLIEAGTYPGIPATETLSVGAQWVVSAKVDDQLVYQLTRALFRDQNKEALAAGHPKARSIALDNALTGVTTPLHPGAALFYRNAGLDPP
ncbi:TAXI family TRAP transporter solute-binding subunit [Zavarzinia sp. CC-PAN008]|uniref:TAXI family TRAP transporter solute-binding subunit n=1 Tax=Zavarzinia sp. CC-PAN008 TaxID=3243332 RepID=UPI003F748F62